jgi:hypothetical protein
VPEHRQERRFDRDVFAMRDKIWIFLDQIVREFVEVHFVQLNVSAA